MSLVVAQKTADGPRIVSDTRVMHADHRRPSVKAGVLKTIVARRNLTVCFAGEVALGLDSIRELAEALDGEKVDNTDGLLNMLHERASETGSVEFLIATAMPDSRLARVRPDSIEKDLPTAWIGDIDAFERFQAARFEPDPIVELMGDSVPQSVKVMRALQRAMQTVIDDSAVRSVDDFCVSIANRPTGFEYLESTFIHVGREILIRPGDDVVSSMAQPVDEGGYAVSIVEPAQPGTPALGLCFPQARLGMLYLPLKSDHALIIRDVSPNDFPRIVLERFGVAMKLPQLRYADVD